MQAGRPVPSQASRRASRPVGARTLRRPAAAAARRPAGAGPGAVPRVGLAKEAGGSRPAAGRAEAGHRWARWRRRPTGWAKQHQEPDPGDQGPPDELHHGWPPLAAGWLGGGGCRLGAGQHHRPIADHDQPQRECRGQTWPRRCRRGQEGPVRRTGLHPRMARGGGDQPGRQPLLGLADLPQGVGLGVDGGGQVIQHPDRLRPPRRWLRARVAASTSASRPAAARTLQSGGRPTAAASAASAEGGPKPPVPSEPGRQGIGDGPPRTASEPAATSAMVSLWLANRGLGPMGPPAGNQQPAGQGGQGEHRPAAHQPHPTAATNPTATPVVSGGPARVAPGGGGPREAHADEEQTEPGHRAQGQGGHR